MYLFLKLGNNTLAGHYQVSGSNGENGKGCASRGPNHVKLQQIFIYVNGQNLRVPKRRNAPDTKACDGFDGIGISAPYLFTPHVLQLCQLALVELIFARDQRHNRLVGYYKTEAFDNLRYRAANCFSRFLG